MQKKILKVMMCAITTMNLLLKDIWSRWEINFQRKIKVISMKLH